MQEFLGVLGKGGQQDVAGVCLPYLVRTSRSLIGPQPSLPGLNT